MGVLAETFLATWAGGTVDVDALETLLATRLVEARTRWPGVALDETAFVTHLAGRAAAGAELLATVAAMATSDLYLACACARNAPGAVAAFHEQLLSRLPLLLAGLRLDSAGLDEARQIVSQRLLLPRPDGPPRIADYSGRGSLEGWLRIAAIRAVLSERDKQRAHNPLDEDGVAAKLIPEDAELMLLRARHQEDLAAALQTALAALSDRERTLLGLHFMKGLSTIELGTMYGVHRTTVGRWIDSAQQALLEGTRSILAERLQLSESDCLSLIRALRSQLHISFRALGSSSPPPRGP